MRRRAPRTPGSVEDLCYLVGDWKIYQLRAGYRWNVDDLAAAWTARTHARDVDLALDLGCGIGSVLMMVAWLWPAARVHGIEVQAVSAQLARRSIAHNGAAERCTVHDGDLRDASLFSELRGRCALVTGTPPYLRVTGGTRPRASQREGCNFELRGGVESYVDAMAMALAPDGVGVMTSGLVDDGAQRTHARAGERGLQVVTWREVVPREGKPPLFGLHVLRRGSSVDGLVAPEAPLVIRQRDNHWTTEALRMRREMGMPA